MSLFPASEGLVHANVEVQHSKEDKQSLETTMSPCTIEVIHAKALDEKLDWFRRNCKELQSCSSRKESSIKLVIRRDHLLEDSVKAVMSLGQDHLRMPWKVEFVHEPAVDSGGVMREWFQLVSEEVFDPDNGLWLCNDENQMCVFINPDSATACKGDHLQKFRFAGRLLGRALFDQQIVKGHLSHYLYKIILGWPLMLKDLADQDQVYYDSLIKLGDVDDIAALCLDFTITEELAGEPKLLKLVPDGANATVTQDNLQAYYQALLRYRLLERNKPQLTELLLGFFDVIPEAPMTVFSPNELEVALCGLPMIDVEDWKANTCYSGTLAETGASDVLVRWFWEIVVDFDHQMKARLLQFATGSAGVPSTGFGTLRGTGDATKSFTVYGMDSKSSLYPRAHTCFNRIDLPRYDTKEELSSSLRTALTTSAIGFGMD